MGRTRSHRVIEEEVGRLADLPRDELLERWIKTLGVRPPKGISQRLLVLAVAHELQAKHYGPLRSGMTRKLHDIAAGGAVGRPVSPEASRSLQAGTRLIREWNGVTHLVDVVEEGYVWKGETYRSLSAVARAITGARWSGPRFFGVARAGPR